MQLSEIIEAFNKLDEKNKLTLIALLEILRRSQCSTSEDDMSPLIKGLFAGPSPNGVLVKCPLCGK